jgi:hypothetical protein
MFRFARTIKGDSVLSLCAWTVFCEFNLKYVFWQILFTVASDAHVEVFSCKESVQINNFKLYQSPKTEDCCCKCQ